MDQFIRTIGTALLLLIGILGQHLFVGPMAAMGKDLQIFSEENMPLTGTKDGEPVGYAVEVVGEIQKRLGTNYPINFVPWARGYEAAQTQPYTMIFLALRIEEREKLFKWVGPLTIVRASFYGKKRGVVIKSLEDAKKLPRIGIPRKFWSEQFLLDHGFENLDVSSNPALMVKKFVAGRYPVFVSIDHTLPTILANEGVPVDDIVPLYTFLKKSHYLAFSPSTPDDVVLSWQKELDGMKKDGTFARIYMQWFPGRMIP